MKALNFKVGVCLFVAVFALCLCTSTFAAQEGSRAKEIVSEVKEMGNKVKEMGSEAKKDSFKPQTVCPIMGGKINKKVYADVAGHRIYACCPACLEKIKKDPKAAIAAIIKKGEMPESHLVVCKKCGELKGTKKCCKIDAEKCPKCGLNNGSIGCCKDLKPVLGQKEILLCAKCGQIKGTKVCCNKEAVKCSKCGLAKGSPLCCKIKPEGSDTKK